MLSPTSEPSDLKHFVMLNFVICKIRRRNLVRLKYILLVGINSLKYKKQVIFTCRRLVGEMLSNHSQHLAVCEATNKGDLHAYMVHLPSTLGQVQTCTSPNM